MRRKIIWLTFMLIMFAATVGSQENTEIEADGNEILQKVDENLMPVSFESYRKLINEEPDGSKKEFIFLP